MDNHPASRIPYPESRIFSRGRENVYLNGAILGLHKAEIDAQFDDAPGGGYSSVMAA